MIVALGLGALLHGYLGYGHKMWLVGTIGGVVVNFFLNKYWTFKHVN